MATQLQIRRGSDSQVSAFTGAEGEIVVNTTNDSIHVNDGSTAGGFELARADLNNVSDTDLNAALTGNTVSALTVTSLTSSGIDVTGTVTADGLTVDGVIDVTSTTSLSTNLQNTGGSALLPTYSFNGSADVGMFCPSINNLAFATSQVERLNIASNGDISFYEDTGTTPKLFWDASAEDLQIGGNLLNLSGVSSGTTGARISANGGGTLRLASGGVDALYVVDGGNVGIGTSSPSSRIHIQNDSDTDYTATNFCTAPSATISNTTSGALNYASLLFSTEANGEFAIGAVQNSGNTASDFVFASRTSGIRTERMRIDSSGNLLVGKTALADSLVGFQVQSSGRVAATMASASGDAQYVFYSTGAGAYRFYVRTDGQIFATSTSISGVSDERLKENIRDLDDGLNKIMALRPRIFDWKPGKGKDKLDDRGFVAQEFEQVFPDLVDQSMDEPPEGEEPYKSVSQDLIPVLVKAIQEQQATITALEARITQLENN